MAKLVRIEELAELLGVSVATVRRYRASGMPVHGVTVRGRPSLFDAPECIAWYVNQEVGSRIGGSEGEPLDLDQERARLAKAQADKTELEVARLRREQIPVSELAAAWEIIGSTIRSRYLSLASRVGPALFAADSAQELVAQLHEAVIDPLHELQDMGVPDLDSPEDDPDAIRH